jgi:hypothetical protein
METISEIINTQRSNIPVIFKYGNSTDLTSVSVDCIVQQGNCLTVKSHGFSKKISEKYPWADVYKQRRVIPNRNLALPEDRGVPGTLKIMKSPQSNVPDVVCLLAQWDFGVGNGRKLRPYIQRHERK